MAATIISNAQLHVTSDEFAQVDTFAISDHRIVPMDPSLLEDGTSEEIDMAGLHVCPGFIDLLVNGCAGVNFANEVNIDCLENMRRWEANHGTTTFVPTLISSSRENTTKALLAIAEFKEKHPGACPGVHLEGPFINSVHKGFHPTGFIRQFTENDIGFIVDNLDSIAYMTIAPESIKPKFIIELLSKGVKLSLGHTACSYPEAVNCFRAGVQNVTHLFNAMHNMNGREPGLIGAFFSNDTVTASVIPDGKHLHPAIIRFLHRMYGDRIYIISDAQGVAGMQRTPSSFAVGGNEIFVDAKRGLIDSKGSLAGTSICMMDGVQFLVERCGYSLDEALRAATIIPAKVLGLTENGIIAGGYIADLVAFDDDFKIRYVIQNGFVKTQAELTV